MLLPLYSMQSFTRFAFEGALEEKPRPHSSPLFLIFSMSERSKVSNIVLRSSSFLVFSVSTSWKMSSNTPLLSSLLDSVLCFSSSF